MTISELQKQAHEIAKSKGWWDRERRYQHRVDYCIFCHKYGGTVRVARDNDGKKLNAYYHQECLEYRHGGKKA